MHLNVNVIKMSNIIRLKKKKHVFQFSAATEMLVHVELNKVQVYELM